MEAQQGNEEVHKKKKLRNNNLFRLMVALVIMCACAGLGVGIAVLEDKSDPTQYVAEYFGKFLIQDYEGMYAYIDQENAYISKSAFAELMTKRTLENNVGEYEFEKVRKEEGHYVLPVQYKDAQTGEEKEFDISLIQQRESWKQLVADWKISIDDDMVRDVTIQIPEGMQLEINGEIIGEENAVIEGNGFDRVQTAEGETIVIHQEKGEEMDSSNITYRFPKILKGTYQIRALTNYTQIVKEVELTETEQKIIFDRADVTVHEKYARLIETQSPEMIQEFYEVVRKRKSSSKKLLTYFTNEEKVVNKVKKLAKQSQEIIYWPDTKNIDDYQLIEYNFSDLTDTAEYIGEQQFKVTYTFDYEYVSSTDTALENSYVYTLSGQCSTTMTLTYRVAEGGIKISAISMKNKNKKNQEEE